MDASTVNLNRALAAWAATHEYGTLAATCLLIEHGSWLKRRDFLENCIVMREKTPTISWREARKRLDADAFHASSSELTILDLAITLAMDSHRLSLLGFANRELVHGAITVALGLARPAVTQ